MDIESIIASVSRERCEGCSRTLNERGMCGNDECHMWGWNRADRVRRALSMTKIGREYVAAQDRERKKLYEAASLRGLERRSRFLSVYGLYDGQYVRHERRNRDEEHRT
jgi:hypothetical protein